MSEQDPVTWLREQVSRRLELARAATQAPWEAEGDDPTDDEVWIDVDGEGWRLVICRGPQSHENMLHVAANGPLDVIAECEAQLAILDEYEARDKDADLMLGPATRRQSEWNGLQLAVRLLLGAYRHRDGYRPEWQTVHGFSLATMLPAPSTGRVELFPEAVTPAFAAIKKGDTVNMHGRDWRVAHRAKSPDGGIALDLEEP